LKLQDRTADKLRELRHEHGALDLETIEPRPVWRDGQVVDLQEEARTNAKNLIEDFMIAANGVSARFLASKNFPSLRRVVRSTAPNRRFPDLITHRMIKAALANAKPAYAPDELNALATHCTEAEDAANKVERQVRKAAAALLLSSHIGEHYDGVVTGASEKGT